MACVSNANAAGYSCPTYKKYTSCSANYYLNGTGAGNSCAACPAGCTCAGGTAAPVCCTSDCTYGATRSVSCSASNAAAASGTQTCNATKNGVSDCYTWGGTTGCVATSCNSSYYLSGGACYTCTGVSFTDSGTDTTTDTSACTATSQTITVSITGGSYKQNQTRSGSRTGTRSKSRTCYRTGGAGGTNGSSACTGTGNCGSYSYGSWSYGSCSYGAWSNSGSGYSYSCNPGYYLSGTSCNSCTGVSFTDSGTDTGTDTSGCAATSQTITVSISHGSYKQNQTRTGSRSWSQPKSRTCYRTGGAGGTSDASSCTGSGNCGAYSYGTKTYGSCSYGGWSNSGGAYEYSCDAGYYWNGSACAACEAGYYCPGFSGVNSPSSGHGRTACSNKPANSAYVGSATSNACPWSCIAGYYGSSANGNTSCADCGSGNYCTGGTHRASCSTTVKAGAPTPSSYVSLSSGSWSDYEHGASANDCLCNWNFSDETRTNYLNQSACNVGPAGNNYTSYFDCRTGYYAADPLNWGDWYTSCKPCTNKPANSTYTSYSTPSVMYAVESNCPWQCNANHYKNGTACTACNSGYTAPAGSTAASACTKSCTRACTQQSCPSNAYSCTHGNASTSGTDAQGVGCDAPASTCSLTINSCKAGNYKDGNSCKACPSTHPNSADDTTGGSGSCYKSCTRACAQQTCPANATCTHGNTSTSGTEYYGGSCSAAASTCSITVTCNPGYYKNSEGTCTPCENGYYCTGNNARTQCSTLGAGYTASDGARSAAGNCYQSCSKACTQQSCPSNAASCTHGSASTSGTQHYGASCTAAASTCSLTINSCKSTYYKNGNACATCPSGYPNSADGNTTGITACFSNTKSRPWSGGQTACAKPDNCASVECNSCSIPACDYTAYANSAGTGDGTVKTGCSTNNVACQQTVKSVKANANYYVNGTSCSACSGLAGGFNSSADNNSGGASVCYKSCSVPCITQACGANVESCTNGTDTKTGTQYYGGACSASAVACPITVNSCKSGNYKDGNSCKACPSSHPNSAGANTGGAGTCYVSCGDISIANGTDKPVSATVYNPGACTYTRVCNTGYNLTSGNVCAALCTAGITSLKSGSGAVVPLYAARQTTHTINVGSGANVCYGSLASGAGANAINVNIGGTTYHTVH